MASAAHQRNAQVTLFIIFVIIVVIVVLGFVFFAMKIPRHSTERDLDLTSFRTYIQSCIDQEARDAVYLFSTVGDPSSNQMVFIKYEYLAVFFVPNDVPNQDHAIKSIAKDFSEFTESCIATYPLPLDITIGEPIVEVTTHGSTITFIVDYPMRIYEKDLSKDLGTYMTSVSYPLDTYLQEARVATNAIVATYPYLNISALSTLSSNYDITFAYHQLYYVNLYKNDGTAYTFMVNPT